MKSYNKVLITLVLGAMMPVYASRVPRHAIPTAQTVRILLPIMYSLGRAVGHPFTWGAAIGLVAGYRAAYSRGFAEFKNRLQQRSLFLRITDCLCSIGIRLNRIQPALPQTQPSETEQNVNALQQALTASHDHNERLTQENNDLKAQLAQYQQPSAPPLY